MALPKAYREARKAAEAVCSEHGELMKPPHNHEGANYCPCELAVRYRELSQTADDLWAARNKPRSAEQRFLDEMGRMIDDFVDSHTPEEVDEVMRKTDELLEKVKQRAVKLGY